MKFKKFIYFDFMYTGVLIAGMSVYHKWAVSM